MAINETKAQDLLYLKVYKCQINFLEIMRNFFASIFMLVMMSIITYQTSLAYGVGDHGLVKNEESDSSTGVGNGIVDFNEIVFTTVGNGLTKGSHGIISENIQALHRKENGLTKGGGAIISESQGFHGKGNSIILSHKGGGGYY